MCSGGRWKKQTGANNVKASQMKREKGTRGRPPETMEALRALVRLLPPSKCPSHFLFLVLLIPSAHPQNASQKEIGSDEPMEGVAGVWIRIPIERAPFLLFLPELVSYLWQAMGSDPQSLASFRFYWGQGEIRTGGTKPG
jgi:hypothetical protein